MLDILMSLLPEGLEVTGMKNKKSASSYQIWLSYNSSKEVVCWLQKMCSPGYEVKLCKQTIASAMLAVALDRQDADMAEYWKEKMLDP